MARKKLLEVFDIQEQKVTSKPVADYEIFKDKELLDNLRNIIISNLLDDNIPDNKMLHEYINDEIDKALKGYDLTNLERNHIFNLIDNEINGYGPLSDKGGITALSLEPSSNLASTIGLDVSIVLPSGRTIFWIVLIICSSFINDTESSLEI